MKSNQERSNECLPPKKRELAASTLTSEERSMAMAPATDSQRTENLAWLASVAGGPEGGGGTRHRGSSSSGGESEGARYKPLCSASDSISSSSSLRLVTSLPTMYTSPVVSQSTVGGAIHYTQLPPNLQFIASPYPAPYAGYISSISSQMLPPPLSSSSSSYLPPRSSSHTEMVFSSASSLSSSTPPSSSSQTSKFDQQRAASLARASMPPPPTDATPHHHHHAPSSAQSAAPRTVLSPHHHQGGAPLPPLPLHPHHTLGHGMSHVVLQYADGPSRKEDGGPRPRELLNGEVERGRRFGASPESGLSNVGNKSRDSPSWDSRQMAPPSDYATHDPSAVRTSVMLMPNSHGDHQLAPAPRASPDKRPPSAPTHLEKGGIIMGKPVSRTPSSSSSSSLSSAASSGSPFAFPSPLSVDCLKAGVATVSPHTVIHTTHSATEPFSVGFPSTSIYPVPQSPLIGYLAGGGGGQQQPIGYQTGLPQHLLIPGAQPVIIPVSGASVATLEPSSSHATASTQGSPFPATLPHAYITTGGPKGEAPESSGVPYQHHHHHAPSGAVIQAQLHLPVAPAQAPPPASGADTTPSMPPYFIKGSIIQLADGELKRVEELKTEDFIQSAEISSELKIDSSTVERIDGSHTSPNFAVVQFSVGEHRAQVCVEVLVEYPFFVFGQGWSSCCPDRTTQLLELPCTKLSVGDVCISLTLKNLKNGSLKKTQTFELVTPAAATASGHVFLKSPRAVPDGSRTYIGGNSRHGERANGVSQRGSAMSGGVGATGAENGELGFEERGLVSKGQGASNTEASTRKPAASRKRRWSAPEGRKVEKTEEEPPLVLPKPSFIPHELKVSIEGRSNIGK